MSFLGMQLGEKTMPGYRKKRFAAFVIDMLIVLCLLLVAYSITGRPDFLAVKTAMDAAQAGAAGPDSQALGDVMFNLFNAAFSQSLLIWFLYEVVTQAVFSGATIGKRIMKLRIVSWDPNRKRVVHHFMMIVRSAVKFLSMYLFQGFPFLIASLTIFANTESRSGFDLLAKTSVEVQEAHEQEGKLLKEG